MARNVPNLPVLEAMKLWGELVECLHGRNRHGGNVAEMYAYRLHGHSPAVAAGLDKVVTDAQDEESDLLAAVVNDVQAEAGANLYAVLAAFAEHYEADVTVEDVPLEVWGDRPFHRVHVRCTKHRDGTPRKRTPVRRRAKRARGGARSYAGDATCAKLL